MPPLPDWHVLCCTLELFYGSHAAHFIDYQTGFTSFTIVSRIGLGGSSTQIQLSFKDKPILTNSCATLLLPDHSVQWRQLQNFARGGNTHHRLVHQP
jgi:hypothetical protein